MRPTLKYPSTPLRRMFDFRHAAAIIAALAFAGTAKGQVFIHIDFEHDNPGPYTRTEAQRDFDPPWMDGIDEGLADIVSSSCGLALRVSYPAHAVGKGIIIPVRLPRRDSYYLAYRFSLPAEFDFVKEGKLSGLCGGACNSGGNRDDDDWSSRIIWRTGGRLAQYIYLPDQAGKYGDIDYWNGTLTTGQWHVLQTYVRVNHPDKSDGVLKSWLDGRLVYNNEKVRLRTSDAFAVDLFKFETFFGGSSADFSPATQQFALFNDITVSEVPIALQACNS